MKKFRRAFIFVVCVSVVLSAQPPGTPLASPLTQDAPAQKGPVLSVRPAPVLPTVDGRLKLDVVVTGKQGGPVSGLELGDFMILDNKHTQKILGFHTVGTTVQSPETSAEVILLLDTVNASFQQAAFARQQVENFLTQNGGHLAYLTSIAVFSKEGLRIQPGTSTDGKALAEVLNQASASLDGGGAEVGGYGEMERFQLSVRSLSTIAENEAKKPGRKMLIWIGPGWPLLVGANFASSGQDRQRIFDVIVELSTRLREARIALYSISPLDAAKGGAPRMPATSAMPMTAMASSEAPPAPRAMQNGSGAVDEAGYKDFLRGVKSAKQADSGNLALQVLAVQSGGRVLNPSNDLAALIADCLTDISSIYTLSFDPPHAEHADEYHELKVVVAKPGLTARTSSGYYTQP